MISFTTNIEKLESLISLFFKNNIKDKYVISYILFLSEVIHLNKYGKPICSDQYYIDNGKIYGVNISKIIDNHNTKQLYVNKDCFSITIMEVICDVIKNIKAINIKDYNIDLDKSDGKINWETYIINKDVLEDLLSLGDWTKNIVL